MTLYQIMKRAVPLKWKVGFHKYKALSKDVAVRVQSHLTGSAPIPPSDFVHLVTGQRSAYRFLNGGRSASETIRETLLKHGIEISQLGAVLDFGCGVGRIMRHWSAIRHPVWYGTDYNPRLVEWCRNHLKFAEFEVNTLSDRLPYKSETFDLIYAFSVFTHLSETLQFYWIDELSRVLKPGGYIYMTTHGEYYHTGLSPEEQRQFRNGRLVVREPEQSGSNICCAYHPVSYVRAKMARNFDLVDFIQSGAKGNSTQDIYLLKKSTPNLAVPGESSPCETEAG